MNTTFLLIMISLTILITFQIAYAEVETIPYPATVGPSTPIYDEVETITVPASDIQTLTFVLSSGEKFKGSFSVSGGSGNDVGFWVTDPSGNQVVPERIVQSVVSFEFEADSDGAHTLNFDNSMSIVSDKIVNLTYEIESPIGGGCLIATATFGSEMAPQVQQLRELRDNTLLNTSSGSTFMTGFNSVYYSFSPTIADWERQNPVFKEMVKITLTPMISSLSILNYVDMDSESSVLGYGISLILLNVGMYFVAPALIVMRVKSEISK